MIAAIRSHWGLYLIEAWGLGTFMLVAGVVAALLAYAPASFSEHALIVRSIFGLAMGLTAIAIIYSPWGTKSGAHINPAVTITFLWLGKIARWDAAFYIAAQFIGGAIGLALAALAFPVTLARPSVNYIVTVPGGTGAATAFAAEFAMTFVLMTVILYVSNAEQRIARLTGLCAGVLVALYITLEAPLSGMSLNPARTVASAIPAHDWNSIWVYFSAPPLGMLLAALAYTRLHGFAAVRCAKLNHFWNDHCHFHGRFHR
jgi:aquaporin Z